jgi:hypothetical protein
MSQDKNKRKHSHGHQEHIAIPLPAPRYGVNGVVCIYTKLSAMLTFNEKDV